VQKGHYCRKAATKTLPDGIANGELFAYLQKQNDQMARHCGDIRGHRNFETMEG
jgi:hypothetical protein